MSVDRELLARWRTLVARRDPEAAEGWEDEPSPYFLHSFRPDGAGLEELFVDMPHGEEVLARLRAVFKAGDATSGHAYLVPRKAPLATRAQLRGWAQGYLEALAQIARAVDATGPGALALTEGGLEVEVEVGLAPEETEASEMRTVVYELVTDFGHSLTPASAHGDLLDEPLYCLANDYALAFYVLWPQLAASASATVADPFAPYFELWRHQATLRYASGGVQVYVPRARGAAKLASASRSAPPAADGPALDAAWAALEEGLGADLTLLRRGAKPGELAELERALGQAIHPSVRAALLRHDGSRDLLGESIEWQLLNAREVCEMRRDWGTAAPTGWWPLAANEPRLLCVDGRGCVMEVDVDFEERPRAIAASVAAWLTAIAPPPRVRPDDGLVPLIEQLVADGELELAEGASLDQLADAIRERMTDGDDAKQRATLALAALIRSALVEEVYLDEAALARRLAALT